MNASQEEILELYYLDNINSLLITSGFVNKTLILANREKAVQDILIYYVLRIRLAELDEIHRGLDTIDLPSFLRRNSSLVSRAFCQSKDVTMDSDDLKNKISIEVKSEPLSNKQREAIDWFRKFIHQLPITNWQDIIFHILLFV